MSGVCGPRQTGAGQPSRTTVVAMLLQATLNGPFSKEDHPGIPISADELAHDAQACVAAGARAIHLHPRGPEGRERLDGEIVNHVVEVVRESCRVPVGASTGAWLEPDLEKRLAHIRGWQAPDYASVNMSEQGSMAVMSACLEAGVGVEAGVWTPEDAQALIARDLARHLTRLLIEPMEASALDALPSVQSVHEVLDAAGLADPRLQHGDSEATWPLLIDAVCRGIDTRIGLEDTFYLPAGQRAQGNPELVRAAVSLGAGQISAGPRPDREKGAR
jgi:uncharacterized protein (DUF849 family)